MATRRAAPIGLIVGRTPEELARRLNDAAAVMAEAADALRRTASPRDWIAEYLDDGDGDGIRSDEAGHIIGGPNGGSADTAIRWADAAALAGKPIGFKVAGAVWIFSRRRILDMVERKGGRPARLEAESRARAWALRSPAQKSA
jgi:hypothetical protein